MENRKPRKGDHDNGLVVVSSKIILNDHFFDIVAEIDGLESTKKLLVDIEPIYSLREEIYVPILALTFDPSIEEIQLELFKPHAPKKLSEDWMDNKDCVTKITFIDSLNHSITIEKSLILMESEIRWIKAEFKNQERELDFLDYSDSTPLSSRIRSLFINHFSG